MTKAVLLPIPFLILMAAATLPAQTSGNYEATAANTAAMREANTIVLRQTLVDANAAVQQKDLDRAQQKYEQAYKLVQDIGPISIPREASETISGLVAVHMELAREAE